MNMDIIFVFVISLALFSWAEAQGSCVVTNAKVPDGFCARKWAVNLAKPRGIFVLPNNDVLTVDQQNSNIYLFYETESGGKTTRHSLILAHANGLNHGVTYGGGYFQTTVYRWAYSPGNRNALGEGEVAISGVPTASHTSRTLLFDNNNSSNPSLIISVGSNTNIDSSGVPGLYRFYINSLPAIWSANILVANGLRNEVGVKQDNNGRLWGVENGIDNLNRADLGGDIHNENPGEEMNLFETDGNFYGYPYCWSQYNLPSVSTPRLTQYAFPQFMNDGIHTDAWCQNTSNVVIPKYSFRAHTAPLDLAFYSGSSFPSSFSGDAFVSLHGSWNRRPPAGYSVVHVNMENGLPVSEENFFSFSGSGETGDGWYRPVGLGWGKCDGQDCLLVTDDEHGNIISITYTNDCNCDIVPPGGSESSTATNIYPQYAVLFVLFICSLFVYY